MKEKIMRMVFKTILKIAEVIIKNNPHHGCYLGGIIHIRKVKQPSEAADCFAVDFFLPNNIYWARKFNLYKDEMFNGGHSLYLPLHFYSLVYTPSWVGWYEKRRFKRIRSGVSWDYIVW